MSSKRSKTPKQRAPINSKSSQNAPTITDPRFAIIHNDPHFAAPRRKSTKVTLDKRFERMKHDDAFSSTATSVDQYGRSVSRKEGREKLGRLYQFEDEDDVESEESADEGPKHDPARGEGIIDTSDEDSDDSDAEIDEDEVEQTRQEIDAAANIPVGEVSTRFAVVNLDWDNVRAFHLFKTFSSFAPAGGKVVKVSVYPSEFGKERMQREEVEGPLPEYFGKSKKEQEDEDEEVTEETIVKEDKGEEDKAALRRWKLDKLRYYYAVVECDKPETASHIYNTCDGTEYETTANFFDLRFIPDDTSFEDDDPRDECDKMPESYRANDFVTDALQHSKVTLNWDEDDNQRKEVAKRAFSQKDIEENELKAYLASDTESENGSDKEASKEKYRALLGGLSFGKKGSKPEGDMEVTFTSALGDNEGGKVIADEPETTIEAYARKERERKQRRKEKVREKKAAELGISVEELQQQNSNSNTTKKTKEDELEEPSQAAVDLGFDDPFFDEPVKSIKDAKKEKRQKDREEKMKAEAAQAKEREELDLLMADEDEGLGEDGKKLRHFDMKQVVKAEKEKGKKKKKKHKKDKSKEGEEVQEGFEIDVKDPRFAALYDKHEFAIDPTNPKFIKTEGMQKLLEERRKRTHTKMPGEEGSGRKSKKQRTDKGDDLQKLVESLKGKAVKV